MPMSCSKCSTISKAASRLRRLPAFFARRIAADPGLGFGKTLAHTLALLANLSLFHGLGVPLLIGASRKRFIKGIAGGEAPAIAGAGVAGRGDRLGGAGRADLPGA